MLLLVETTLGKFTACGPQVRSAFSPVGPPPPRRGPSPGLLRPLSTDPRHRRAQAHPTQQVVRDRIPQSDRLRLELTAHRQPLQPPLPGQGVDALGGRGALLVNQL